LPAHVSGPGEGTPTVNDFLNTLAAILGVLGSGIALGVEVRRARRDRDDRLAAPGSGASEDGEGSGADDDGESPGR
jgi:hypothetical protein